MNSDFNSDIYLRIMNTISLLNETEEGLSVNELADSMGVSPQVVVGDISCIHSTPEMNATVTISDIYGDSDDELFDRVLEGEENDIKLCAVLSDDEDLFSVELSAFERIILSHFLREKGLKEIIPDIKDIYIKNDLTIDGKMLVIIDTLNSAIREKKYVDIELSIPKEKLIEKIIPLRIVNDFSTKEYYLVALLEKEKEVINIFNVEKVSVLEDYYAIQEDVLKQINTEFDYRWGIDRNEEMIELEIKVYDEAKVLRRIKEELSGRKYGYWEDYDGYSIYRDKVIGYESVKLWAMKYGSCIVVRKPEQLAKEIYNLAKERIKVYDEILKEEIGEKML